MAIRTGSVMYTSPSRLKNLAIAVTGADRLETMSRSHESSTRWMWASTPLSATAAKTTAVSASTTAVTAMSRPRRGHERRAPAGRQPPPAHPGHAAPRPHSARPSVLLT